MSWNSTRSAVRFYHPELDVLRFFAFFMVFLHHALPHDLSFYANLDVAPAPIVASLLAAIGATGAFGVNLFFLLSSYLITELLIRERARFGRVDLKSFYVRRILRIWPLYFAFLGLAWLMQWYVPGQHIGWRAGLAFTLLSGNWWIVFVGFPSSVIFPLWSVSIEEQFYIIWPAAMRKLSQRGLLIAAGLMIAVANLTRWYLASRHTWESRIWGNTFVQLDAIALGVILAVLLAGTAPRIARLPRIALFTGGLACLVLAGNYFQIKADPLTVSRVLLGYPVMAIGAVALFLATLRDQPPTDVSNDNKAGGPHPPGARGRSAVSWRVPGGEASFGECGAEAVTGGPYSPSVGECGIEASAYSRKTSAALPHQPVCSEHEDASAVATLAVPSQPERRRMPLPQSRRWQVSQLFVYLGRISYGLYVFHVLGLMISDFAVPHQGASLGRFLYRDTVGFAITVALSAISYRWLETPFLNLKQRFTHVLSRPGG